MTQHLSRIAVAAMLSVSGAAAAEQKADIVFVNKTDRTMVLKQNGRVIRRYRIALGSQPMGHKTREGDGRTPEGVYWIDARNPNSNYHLSLRISYPNAKDRARAEAAGVEPGGQIMIHGKHNGPTRRRNGDWTDGCIAVTDTEMEEIWRLVDVGTPIEISP